MSKNIECLVNGMTCSNCALTIEKSLKDAGANEVSANPMTGEVSFEINDAEDQQKYFDKINSIGYKVVEDEGHESGHEHDTDSHMYLWIATVVTIPLLLHMFVNWPWVHNFWVQAVLGTIVYVIGVQQMGGKAIQAIKNKMPTMEVLVMLGASAAYFYSWIGYFFYREHVQDYMFFETAASIITLVMWGNYLEAYTVKSTSSAIKELMKLKVPSVKLVLKDSMGKESLQTMDAKYLKIGDTIQVNEGERIGADGIVTMGHIKVDESMLTGEALPVEKMVGDVVLEGTISVSGHAQIRVEKSGKQTALNQIIQTVKDAQTRKSTMQKLADRIAAIFVPVVISVAILTLVINYFVVHLDFAQSMMRAIAVLVISCPCAMGLATPAAVMVGLGRASRMGILVKNGDVMEKLEKLKYIVFDKTGTLTQTEQKITQVYPIQADSDLHNRVGSVMHTIEQYSNHPIALSALQAFQKFPVLTNWDVKEIAGRGMEANDNQGHTWRLGARRWISEYVTQDLPTDADLFLAQDNVLVAAFMLEDTLLSQSESTVAKLKSLGYEIVILSGDRQEKVARLANKLNIKTFYAEQSPTMKMEIIQQYKNNGGVVMVGDGINDAPALALADVSISMHGASDIAKSSADIVLLGDGIQLIPQAISLSRATYNTIKGNLAWAFIYNLMAIPVAATGLLSPIWGAGVMALSDVFLLLNSLRLRYRKLD